MTVDTATAVVVVQAGIRVDAVTGPAAAAAAAEATRPRVRPRTENDFMLVESK